MRWSLYLAACAFLAALLWQSPVRARTSAPPAAAPSSAAAPSGAELRAKKPASDLITFEEYRAFRLRLIAKRRASLNRSLTEKGLPPMEKARLERIKGYYDWYAALPAARRDKLFRARFDEIDSNHDGTISEAERAAWRKKEREHYRQLAAKRAAAAQH